VSDDQDVEETPEQQTKEVVELGRQLSLEMKDADVDELTASHSDELVSNEDLLEIRQSSVPFQDAETGEEVMVSPSPATTLGIKRLALIFQKADELVNMTEEEDPNGERSAEVNRGTERELACYKMLGLYEEKKKAAVQMKLDKFFTKQPIG
jgi:hypothetical protein